MLYAGDCMRPKRAGAISTFRRLRNHSARRAKAFRALFITTRACPRAYDAFHADERIADTMAEICAIAAHAHSRREGYAALPLSAAARLRSAMTRRAFIRGCYFRRV